MKMKVTTLKKILSNQFEVQNFDFDLFSAIKKRFAITILNLCFYFQRFQL